MNRRVPLVSLVPVALLLIGLVNVPAMLAADAPQLSASTIPGKGIDVSRTGFPAGVDVQLAIQRNGTDAGSQTLHTDASGSFTATVDAGPGRGGQHTLTATAGSATATVQAVAVETAGGTVGGTRPTPPLTDTSVAGTAQADSSRMLLVAFALGLGMAGFGLATRVARQRVARSRRVR